MNRRLRITVPITQEQLMPRVSDFASVKAADTRATLKMKKTFDERHRARNLPCLRPGEMVWIPERRELGKVIAESSPRSYTISTPTQTVRRNRRHLIFDLLEEREGSPTPSTLQHLPANLETSSVPAPDSTSASPMKSPKHPAETQNDEQKAVRRSGRVTCPDRLDL